MLNEREKGCTRNIFLKPLTIPPFEVNLRKPLQETSSVLPQPWISDTVPLPNVPSACEPYYVRTLNLEAELPCETWHTSRQTRGTLTNKQKEFLAIGFLFSSGKILMFRSQQIDKQEVSIAYKDQACEAGMIYLPSDAI